MGGNLDVGLNVGIAAIGRIEGVVNAAVGC